jgi:hypothetical protein
MLDSITKVFSEMRTPGMFAFPNSAPLSLTPKYLNFVFVPLHVRPLDDGEEAEVVGEVVVVVFTVVVAEELPCKH